MTDINGADSCAHCGEEPAVHGDACQICWAFMGNVVDPCVFCGVSTAPGSGNFVNRTGADNTWRLLDGTELYLDGWQCPECQCEECDACGKKALEYDVTWCGNVLCIDCSPRYPHEDAWSRYVPNKSTVDPQLARVDWIAGEDRGTWWFRVPPKASARQLRPKLAKAGEVYVTRDNALFCEMAQAGIYWLNDEYDEVRPKMTMTIELTAAP